MTTAEIANRLVELCRQGQIEECQAELFSADAKSIEASEMMGPKVVEGMEAIKIKGAQFQAGVEEFHAAKISDPIIAGNHFAISWDLDATFKGRGRMMISELCLYEVKDGKIISEQFVY